MSEKYKEAWKEMLEKMKEVMDAKSTEITVAAEYEFNEIKLEKEREMFSYSVIHDIYCNINTRMLEGDKPTEVTEADKEEAREYLEKKTAKPKKRKYKRKVKKVEATAVISAVRTQTQAEEESEKAVKMLEKSEEMREKIDEVKGEISGLSQNQTQVLLAVMRGKETADEVVATTGVVKNSLGGVFQDLMKKGYIEKLSRGRYEITEKGRNKVDE